MALRLCFCWLLVCWLAVTAAEGQEEVVTPPGGVAPTDCQIFTLTPPPATRNPVTRTQPATRTPKCPIHFFPRIHNRFPKRPFFFPRCRHRFWLHPFFGPYSRFTSYYRSFPRTRFRRGSSSEESRK